MKKETGMNMSKCTRCAMEQGFNPLNDDRRCIWKAAGTVCPDYDERPDMDSIACEKVPKNETEILRRHLRMLAEKSRFQSAKQLADVTDAMLKIHGYLLIQKPIRFVLIQILLCCSIGVFVTLHKFRKRRS